MTLFNGKLGESYTVKNIDAEDSDLVNFLFTLGCFEGEEITLISKMCGNFVVAIKDGRYNIDKGIAKSISVYA